MMDRLKIEVVFRNSNFESKKLEKPINFYADDRFSTQSLKKLTKQYNIDVEY